MATGRQCLLISHSPDSIAEVNIVVPVVVGVSLSGMKKKHELTGTNALRPQLLLAHQEVQILSLIEVSCNGPKQIVWNVRDLSNCATESVPGVRVRR